MTTSINIDSHGKLESSQTTLAHIRDFPLTKTFSDELNGEHLKACYS